MRAHTMLVRALVGGALLATTLTLWPARSVGQGTTTDAIVALVNARNPTRTMSASQLRAMLTGSTSFWQGTVPVRLFVRPSGSPAGRRTLELLGMSSSRFLEHWQSRQLAGQGVAPRAIESVTDLAGEIGRAPGALGVALASEMSAISGNPRVRAIPVQ